MKTSALVYVYPFGSLHWFQGLRVDFQNRRMEKLYIRGIPFTDIRMRRRNEALIRSRKTYMELENTYLRLRISAIQVLNG